MPRTADFAIQGFLYQFNKTLHAILTSPDDCEIVVEGIIEDIDVHHADHIEAIQCKYHESKDAFVLSLIYKPLLQMMAHFQKNPAASVKYRLFVHCPDPNAVAGITRNNLLEVLATNNTALVSLVVAVKDKIDLDAFLERFTLEFGASLDDLIGTVRNALGEVGFGNDDIEPFAYPNAVQHIADLSIKHNQSDRRITKLALVARLKNIKATAITRWTLALKTMKQILDARKKQLKSNLAKNARRRCFLISPSAASDFNESVIVFLSEYLDKYHSKPNQTETPLFCFDCNEDVFEDLRQRMFTKGLRFRDGFVGAKFHVESFSRKPVINVSRGEIVDRDFSFRLLRYDPNSSPELLNVPHKSDDLFIISHHSYDGLDTRDISVERLGTTMFQQVKYLLGVSDACE